MRKQAASSGSGLLDQPEINVLIFAFLLNYPWEFLQAPLFDGLPAREHWAAVKICTLATVGDAFIMLFAYSLVAAAGWNRSWFRTPRRREMTAFVVVGVLVTVGIEFAATRIDNPVLNWAYAPEMPVLPFIGTGLSPVLQWLLLPPLALWFVRRQLSSTSA